MCVVIFVKLRVSLMPLEKDEGYRVPIGGKRRLEMQSQKPKKYKYIRIPLQYILQ